MPIPLLPPVYAVLCLIARCPRQSPSWNSDRCGFTRCCLVAKCYQLFVTSGLQPTRLLCPWDFPGKNTGAGCHFLLQGICLTQGSNPHLLHWQMGSSLLSRQGSPLGFTQSIHNSLQISKGIKQLMLTTPCPRHMVRPWEYSSVHFSLPVMSDSLQPHGRQHTRPPCPSATTGACSNSCTSSR